VELFFALSGYLITGLLVREFHRTGGIALGQFYVRRALRLYPALIVMLLVGAVFFPVLGDDHSFTGYLRSAAAAAFYAQDFVWGFAGDPHGGFGHAWSLAVEEQFYFIWPPLVLLVLRRGRSVVAVALGVATVSLLVTSFAAGEAFYLPWTQAMVLLSGAVLAGWAPEIRPWVASGVTAAACLGLVLLWGWASVAPRTDSLAPQLLLVSLLSVMLIAGLESNPLSIVARLFAWRPIEYLGRISYGFYLWYLVVIELVEHYVEASWWQRMSLELLIVGSMAVISHHLVEKPFLRMKDRPSGKAGQRSDVGQAPRPVAATVSSPRAS